MSNARRVLDWHRQPATELERELAELPPGRYVLIPEDEAELANILSEDEEAAVEEGLTDLERGDVVSWETVRARGRAVIDARGRR